MSHEHHLCQVQLLYDGDHILTKRRHAPGLSLLAGLAVPGQIERHHGVLLCKVVHLPVPTAAVTTPPVDKHERWRALAMDFIMNRDTVR
jgi:hypothetical protein